MSRKVEKIHYRLQNILTVAFAYQWSLPAGEMKDLKNTRNMGCGHAYDIRESIIPDIRPM